MKRLYIIALFFFYINIYSQKSDLYGFVTEQNSGNKPVRNVIVKSLFANERTTDSDGNFILTFGNASPGSQVSVSAKKESWIVINKEKLNLNLPKDPVTDRLKIVMCEQSVYDARKRKFTDDIERNIQTVYEKKIRQ